MTERGNKKMNTFEHWKDKFINAAYAGEFVENVKRIDPDKNQFAIFWLGQAGFLIKTSDGNTIAIDPCLSDYCERRTGFKRLIPPICRPEDFCCDILLISHEHEDHFDADLIKIMSHSMHYKEIWGPKSIIPLIKKLGIGSKFKCLEYRKTKYLSDIKITPIFSDHGTQVSDAMGFLFDIGNVQLYYAGDTCLSQKLKEEIQDLHPDIAIMPINGEFGNLNSSEAYELAEQIRCRALIPCHYWMYAEHGGLPLDLLRTAKDRDLPQVVYLALGEGWMVEKEML